MTDATDAATGVHPPGNIEQLLTALRESIIHTPLFASGSLQLPSSHLSLFYKITKGDHAARLVDNGAIARISTAFHTLDMSILLMLPPTS